MKKILLVLLIFNFTQLLGSEIKGKVKTRSETLSDAVIYIERIDNKSFIAPDKPVVMDQKDLVFIPHVLPIITGTTVLFPNNDVTRHSVFCPSSGNKFDFGTYAQGTQKSIKFEKAGVIPLLCHVHPEMSAFIVVVETPYFGKSSEDGTYIIKDVPAGKYKLTVWHEWAKGKSQQIIVNENQSLNVNFLLDD